MKVLTEYMDDGYKVQQLESGETRYTSPDGRIFQMPAPPPGPNIMEYIDSRIDLTKPIYDQVLKLAEMDKLAEESEAHPRSNAA